MSALRRTMRSILGDANNHGVTDVLDVVDEMRDEHCNFGRSLDA